jgi:hypothetical protein
MTTARATDPADRPTYCRVRDVTENYGIKKGKLYQLLARGLARAKKVDGVVLVEIASIEALIESAPAWSPPAK